MAYENIVYDYILDPLRDKFITEFTYGDIYIAPEIKNTGKNFQIRLWNNSSETIEYANNRWTKSYEISVNLYLIEQNPTETFFKQFYNDSERVYQLLFDNKQLETTANSVTNNYYDGVPESGEINELDDVEAEIEGLNKIEFIFNCTISR